MLRTSIGKIIGKRSAGIGTAHHGKWLSLREIVEQGQMDHAKRKEAPPAFGGWKTRIK